MTPPKAVVPPLSAFPALLSKVSKQYEAALESGAVFFYPSKVTILRQDLRGAPAASSSSSSPAKAPCVPWTVRCVPALLDKAREKHVKAKQQHGAQKPAEDGKDAAAGEKGEAEKPQQNSSDVFAPPYHPGLLIEELPEHTFLLNKFCVVPKHFLLVTREFEPQTMPPSPAMLSIALRTLLSHKRLAEQGSPDASHDKELMAFYNCGQVSGASQPHQHMQFAELGGEYDASADDRGASVPAEALLDSIPRDGKEEEHVHALPLPYQHFVVLISRAPTSNDEELNTYLGMKLMSLLDALFQARIAAAVNDQGNASAASSSTPQTKQSPSWNLLMTTRAMHLIPRQREEFDGLQKNSGTSGISAMVDEDGMELVGALSINSLGFAGHLLVKSDQELDALQRYPGGIVDVLRHTAIAPVADVTTSLHHEG